MKKEGIFYNLCDQQWNETGLNVTRMDNSSRIGEFEYCREALEEYLNVFS